jgi:hypothetical protein
MSKRKIIIGSIICLSITIFVGQTLSQTRRGSRRPENRYSRPQSGQKSSSSSSSGSLSRQVTDESKEKSIREAVGATDKQWKAIKPRLDRVKHLLQEACMVINVSGGGSGGTQSRGGSGSRVGVSGGAGGSGFSGELPEGTTSETKKESYSWMKWSWSKAWREKDAQREDQKLCELLFNLLENKNSSEEKIKQTIDSLRNAREQTKKELEKAQQELREILTLEQQARLVALGWLD